MSIEFERIRPDAPIKGTGQDHCYFCDARTTQCVWCHGENGQTLTGILTCDNEQHVASAIRELGGAS